MDNITIFPKTNSTLIIENQYFPVISSYKMFLISTHIKFEQCERFQKMSFRNRCIISGSNGLINLTVPIKNGRQTKEMIRDIKIDNEQRWQLQHWRAIESSYRRSPFFEFYSESLKALLFKEQAFLFDLNITINEWLLKKLGIQKPIGFTNDYIKEYNEKDFVDLRNEWFPKNFKEVRKEMQVKYIQVFEDKFGFIPNLSILDLLFCKGNL